ncbi:unnamed protein product [Microthlaspi erraticum]|uniref:non-specific serine/threonine protein kinase n=1 Tax=Microthlaspi erraticum TaxID=1685480 RepID=A0A6D2JC70_9BRAS|nr:unnamed protein product [Microthlaspi erraticum]
MLLVAYGFTYETDKRALLEFKSQISESKRVVLSTWNNSFPLCSWTGVTCGRKHRRVTGLDLRGFQLGGVISPSIGNLSFLRSLDLSNNSFGGTIPQEVGNLFRIKYLYMDSNDLGGEIPASLSNCSRLTYLYLYSNHLGGGVPSELGSLTKLVYLYLGYNNLKGELPASLGNLTSLRNLGLVANNIGGEIPDDIARLSRMVYLELAMNNFSGVFPPAIYNFSSLEYLYLYSNGFSGSLRHDFGDLLPNLRMLHMGKNYLTGAIPASLGNMSSLRNLSFAYNNMEGEVPGGVAKLTQMVYLELSLNNFSGVFPPSVYNLSSLQYLYMFGCGFYGSLRHEFGLLLPNLRVLLLASNSLTGVIPTTLSNISTLLVLAIQNNSLTGSIPPGLGNVRGLQYLGLYSNYLGSYSLGDLEFLGALSNCTQLHTVNVGNNRLGGYIPSSIVNLSTNLIYLSLETNYISGSIPHDIGNLKSLQTLRLHENILTGTLPVSVGKLVEMKELILSSNRMSGEIPSSIGNITRLELLYMFNNSFQGTIPPSLGNCSHMLFLWIGSNKLSGNIPWEIMQVSSLVYLGLESNSLTGSLPNGVGQLQNLVRLFLGSNKLSGKLPQTLGNCLSMETLSLQENSFGGDIPDMRRLVGVKAVDLSNNNLSGSIPEYLANFSSLEYLNLSINNLEGRMPVEGIFQNDTKVFVFGNKNLCGGVRGLKLKPCFAQTPPVKTSHSVLSKKAVIGISVSISLLLLLFLASIHLCWLRKRKKKLLSISQSPWTLGAFHEKLSYGDLRNATNGFSLGNVIGSGSFGTVFKALLPGEQNVVAVKVLNMEIHGAMKSFVAECESWKDIKHRNLVKLLTACSSIDFQGNEFRALIYEFMPNGSLDMWLHPEEVEEILRPSRTLTLLERLNIAIDVASVLDYLHFHCHEAIAHCDIKPSNVLLDDELVAHVSDFGLARLLLKFDKDSFFNQLSSAGVRGTIGYAAPEYGMGGQPSIHGDVYSFGILILEMFSGKRPTNELFGGNCTLHNYTKSALPEKVLDIADQSILHSGLRVGFPVVECLTLILDVGLRCCEESPANRLATSEATKELISIRERFFRSRRTARR